MLKSHGAELGRLMFEFECEVANFIHAYRDMLDESDTSTWPIEHQQEKKRMFHDFSHNASYHFDSAANDAKFGLSSLEEFIDCGPDDVECHNGFFQYINSDDEE